MDAAQQKILLDKLLSRPKETEWVEFKENNADPQQIGEYISALSNAASLHGERFGYIIWGINDDSRQIVGTEFRPRSRKIGNEELENWLHHHLAPNVDFRIHELGHQGKPLVTLRDPRLHPHTGSFRRHCLRSCRHL